VSGRVDENAPDAYEVVRTKLAAHFAATDQYPVPQVWVRVLLARLDASDATLKRVRALLDSPLHIVDASMRYDDGHHDRFGDGDVVTVEMLRAAIDGKVS
jgi:hypothetical protein